MAAFSNPRFSAAFPGVTTTRPGTWVYQASGDCECWAAIPPRIPDRHPGHHRHPGLSTEHVAGLGRLVHQFIHRAHGEIRKAQLRDGPRPGQGGPHCGAHDGRFRNRCIDDPILSEFGLQVAVLTGHTAFVAEILTQRPDRFIPAHFLAQSKPRGFGICHFGHCATPGTLGAPTSCTSVKANDGSGQAAFFASST